MSERTMEGLLRELLRRIISVERRLTRRPGPDTVLTGRVTDLETDVDAIQLRPGRNFIINGSFRTNQRKYTSAAALGVGAYGFDRWKATTAATTLTFVADPHGQTVTVGAGKSIAQIVERTHVPSGDYVLSWEGTAQARLYNVGSAAPAYAVSPLNVNLDGLANVAVEFGAGTVGKVQLERGVVATPFEWVNVTDELMRCKRYFQLFEKLGDTIEFNILNPYFGVALAAGYLYGVPLTPSMRAAPALYHPTTPTSPNCGFDFDYYNASGAIGRYVSFATTPNNIKPYYNSGNNGGATLPAVTFRGRAQLAIWVDAEL